MLIFFKKNAIFFDPYIGVLVRRIDYFKYVEKVVKLGKRSEFVGGGLIRSSGGWSEVSALRARAKITLHFKRRCILPDFVTKA
jgi:hypothetical protein